MINPQVWTCFEYNEATSTCTTEGWAESPSLLPPLAMEDATTIAAAFLMAMACVVAVKMAFKKSQ